MSPESGLIEAEPKFSVAERLQAIIERAPGLEPHLDKFALSNTHYDRIYNQVKIDEEVSEEAELKHKMRIPIAHPDFEEETEEPEREILLALIEELAEGVDDYAVAGNPAEDWQGLSDFLLEKAVDKESQLENDKHSMPDNTLLAAFCSALLPDDRQVREHFLQSVYRHNLQEPLRKSLHRLSIIYIFPPGSGSRRTNTFDSWAAAFDAHLQDIEYYIAYTKEQDGTGQREAKPKMRQREVYDAYRHGSVNKELLEMAEADSWATQGEQSSVIDPHKIERFALQQMYMQDLLQMLFPDNTLENSPLRSSLRAVRSHVAENTSRELQTQFTELFSELTTSAQQPYKGASNPKVQTEADIALRTAASARFRQITQHTNRLQKAARFLDYNGNFVAVFEGREIWSTSSEAAALPAHCRRYIDVIRKEANRLQADTGDQPVAEELYELALAKRKFLVQISMLAIEDFGLHIQDGPFSSFVRAQAIERTTVRSSLMSRDEKDRLDIVLPYEAAEFNGKSEVYRGVKLGCIAGRVALENSAELRSRNPGASNNFIDYLAEIMIDEAYERGLFNLDPQAAES